MQLLKEFDNRVPDLKYLGFGFWQAWPMMCYVGSFLNVDAAPKLSWWGASVSYPDVLFAICTFTLACTVGVLSMLRKPDRLTIAPWFAPLGGIITALASVGICLSSSGIIPSTAFFCVAAAVAGVGNGCSCIVFGTMFGILPPRQSILHVCHSMMLCCVVYFVASSSPYFVKASLYIVCPLATGALTLLGAIGDAPKYGPKADQHLSLLPSIWRFFIAMLVLAAVSSLVRSPLLTHAVVTNNSYWSASGMFVVLVVASVLAIHCKASREPWRLSKLYGPVCVMLIVFLMVIVLANNETNMTFAMLTSAPWNLLNLILDAMTFNIIYLSKMSPVKIIGLAHAFKSFGMLLGGTMGFVITLDGVSQTVLYCIIIFITIVVITLVAPEHVIDKLLVPIEDEDDNSIESIALTESEQPDGERAPHPSQSAQGKVLWQRRCDAVCKRYLLTPREQEVLYMLSHGHGSEFISNQLTISLHTARTHTRNIYAKTNVHSREELIRLIKETEVEER